MIVVPDYTSITFRETLNALPLVIIYITIGKKASRKRQKIANLSEKNGVTSEISFTGAL